MATQAPPREVTWSFGASGCKLSTMYRDRAPDPTPWLPLTLLLVGLGVTGCAAHGAAGTRATTGGTRASDVSEESKTGHRPPDARPPSDAEEIGAAPKTPPAAATHPAAALDAALSEPDPAARARSLEALAKIFAPHRQLSELIASVLVQTYAELHDLEKMQAWAHRVEPRDHPTYADVLNAMAYAYAETGTHLDEGMLRVEQALAIVDRISADMEKRQVPAAARAPIETRRGAFLDTRGWLHFRAGRLEPALADLDAAAAILDEAEVHWHRGQVLEALGKSDEAVAAYADAVAAGGPLASRARQRLSALHPDTKAVETAIEAAHARRAARKRAHVLERAIDRPTPALHVVDAAGATVTIGGAEVPGRVQVFWLWATWCKPCLMEMPVLEALATRRENEDVAFLAVNVDQDPTVARRFLQRRDLKVPVAFGELQSLIGALDVGGLPALFIRDARGHLRFVHVGLPESPEALLSGLQEEIDALRATSRGGDHGASASPRSPHP